MREKPADPHHRAEWVGVALPVPPTAKLLRQIGRRLAGKRRESGPQTLAVLAMTQCAGWQVSGRIALVKQQRRLAVGGDSGAIGRLCRQRCIVLGNSPALVRRELSRDVLHLRMAPQAVGIGVQLPFEITWVQAGEPRYGAAITFAGQPVAGDAGIYRAGLCPAQRYKFAAGGQRICRSRFDRPACCQRRCGHAKAAEAKKRHLVRELHSQPLGSPIVGNNKKRALAKQLLLLASALALGACKPPPEERLSMPLASAVRGERAVAKAGCGACHTIEGIRWPRGEMAPALGNLRGRGLIAGRLPNRPDVLAAFIRNAPAMVPDTAMPDMPVTEREARDIAQYLYQVGG